VRSGRWVSKNNNKWEISKWEMGGLKFPSHKLMTAVVFGCFKK
jgi:hypothetical protein